MKKWIAYGVIIVAMLTTVILYSKQNTRLKRTLAEAEQRAETCAGELEHARRAAEAFKLAQERADHETQQIHAAASKLTAEAHSANPEPLSNRMRDLACAAYDQLVCPAAGDYPMPAPASTDDD